jgi:hypothetical protein
MTIESMINRLCTQKCVYWGSPAESGRGDRTYADAVELDCRWEEKTQVLFKTDNTADQVSSRAIVYLEQDVEEKGMLYLGTLETLYDLYGDSSAGGIDNPESITNTYMIRRFEKYPSLDKSGGYMRRAWLTPLLT